MYGVNIQYTTICTYRPILLLITFCLSIRHDYVDLVKSLYVY